MSNMILSTSLSVGRLTLANRIVIPAMHTNLASPQGDVTEAMIAHYRQRARGGAGLVIVEVATVHYPWGRQSLTELQIENASCLPGLSRLAATIKAEGTSCFLQLFHAGAQTLPFLNGGNTPLSPSGTAVRVLKSSPRALEHEEIIAIQERFIQAGIWAVEAGFDGIELHAAHGYLLSEFLSPLTNQRTDEYGGTQENRCRLMTDIIQGIKERCPDLVVGVRMNGDDFLPGGIKADEAAGIAALLEQSGADLINVSAGMYDSGLTSIESNAYPEGWRLNLSAAVKAAVKIPVIGGGVILEGKQAEAALQQGMCDLVYIGRASLADFEWPHKVLSGKPESIRPCIRCNTCVASSFAGGPIRCAVNPEVGGPPDEREHSSGTGSYYWLNTGNEKDFRLLMPSEGKVLVVGSGPAGLTAALTAARAGYRVTLAELSDKLGGLLTVAAQPLHKGRIAKYRDYLVNEVSKAGIKVLTNITADTDFIREETPDLLVAALGSQSLPWLAGEASDKVISVEEAFNGNYVSQRCLIIGGGETGLEVAQVLAMQGAMVTVVEKAPLVAAAMEKKNRRSLLNSLKELPVTIYTNSDLVSWQEEQALLSTPEGECHLTFDKLIPAWGREPIPVPDDWLKLGIPTLVLGDGAAVGSIAAATRAAHLAFTKL